MSIENVGQTEEMRHIPRLSLLIEKLDRDVRPRLETLYASCFDTLHGVDSAHLAEFEARFRQVCRWLERLGEQARGRRAGGSHEFNLLLRVRAALNFAIESLSSVDSSQFRRRQPAHLFERSRAECVYAAFMMVTGELDRIAEMAAAFDPDVRMKLIEPPYSLEPPPVPTEAELAAAST